MRTHRCDEVASTTLTRETGSTQTASRVAQAPGMARRGLNLAGWIVPGALLALLPKCPACLAAYLAIGTGVAISVSVAASLKLLLVILCVALLFYLAARPLRYLISWLLLPTGKADWRRAIPPRWRAF